MPQLGERLIAGTSSFGMSGVNAHGLYSPPQEVPAHVAAALPWLRTRHWFVPNAHHLLQAFAYTRQAAVARCAQLCMPTAAQLSMPTALSTGLQPK